MMSFCCVYSKIVFAINMSADSGFKEKEPLTMRGWLLMCLMQEGPSGILVYNVNTIMLDYFNTNKHELLVPPSGETLSGTVCKSPVMFLI